MSDIANLWILQFKQNAQASWLPFGLPHPFDDATVRLEEIRTRMPDAEWRLINTTTGGILHDRRDSGSGGTS